MQDAVGAWIKSRVARAVLLGVDIKTPKAFFEFCENNLTDQGKTSGLSKKVAFTSNRYFVFITLTELSTLRHSLPKTSTWVGLNAGWFSFRSTGEGVGHLSRQWLACMCEACTNKEFKKCEHKEFLTANDQYYNLDQKAVIISRPRNKDDEIKQAEQAILTLFYP